MNSRKSAIIVALIFLAALFSITPLIANAAVTLVQGPYNQDCGSPVATCAQTYTSPVTAGNLAVITFFIHNTAAPTVSDTDGATFTISCASLNIWQNCTAYTTVLNNHGGSAYTVTVHNGGSNTEMEIAAAEVSGGAVSCQVTGTGTGTTATTSSSCSFSGSWFIMASASDNNGAGMTIGASFTVCSSGWITGTKCQYDTTSVTSPTSFPFTWTGSSGWQDAGIAITPSTVTLPFVCHLSQFGATTATMSLSVSAGSVVPSTASCSKAGVTTNLTVNPTVTVTATVPTISAGVGYWFSGKANTTSTTSCGSGTCSNWSVTAYQLDTVTATVNQASGIGSIFDTGLTWTLTATQAGGGASPTITSTAAASDSTFLHVDYKSNLVFPASATGAVSNVRWESSTGASVTFNITTGAGTKSVTYYRQVTNTFGCTPAGPGQWDGAYACAATGTYLGAGSSTIATVNTASSGGGVSASGYSDSGTTVTLPYTLHGYWDHSTTNIFPILTTGGTTYTTNYQINQTVTITIAESPNHIINGLIINGTFYSQTTSFTWRIDSNQNITASKSALGPGGKLYGWSSWSDSGARSHTYNVPSGPATVTASFATPPPGVPVCGGPTPFIQLQTGCWLPAVVNYYSIPLGLPMVLGIILGDIDMAIFIKTRNAIIAAVVFTIGVSVLGAALPGIFSEIAYGTLSLAVAGVIYKLYTLRS